MWEGLLGSIRQMGVFMICAQALIYFKPNGSYEKYLKLLVSAMILVQLLSPVAALLLGKEGQSLEERIGFYNNFFEQGMGEAAFQEYRVEQIRQQLMITQIQAQMESWDLQLRQQETDRAEGEEGQSRPPQGDSQAAEQDARGIADDIHIQIDPVTIGAPEGGRQDMGQGEDEHGGEDKERGGEMAEEG